ncbi:hypothetical protein ACIRCZ_19765 [Leifsonia sp. NPDC102414]|uniref:hypothetical protein n=1 Tax=Leifsonia sp. NPDC102414 TaxID=3364124 RepID=UPI003816C9B4
MTMVGGASEANVNTDTGTQDSKVDSIGEWVICGLEWVEHEERERPILLAVGDREFGGSSPRRSLDQRSREVMFAPLVHAMTTGQDARNLTTYREAQFDVVVRVVRSPDRSTVLGAYGIFVEAGTSIPAAPVIGTWQWHVFRDTGTNFDENASVWDDALFSLYEFPRDWVSSVRGPVGDWLSKLIATTEDRAKMKRHIDTAVSAATHLRQLFTYKVVTRYGTANPGFKYLSLCGRTYDDPEHTEALWMRGFTREVKSASADVSHGLAPVSPDALSEALTDAAFRLSRNLAFAAVDLLQARVFLTSPSWSEFGLQPDYEGSITALLNGEDRDSLERALDDVSAGRAPAEALELAFMVPGGAAMRFIVEVTHIDPAPSRYLLVSLRQLAGAAS